MPKSQTQPEESSRQPSVEQMYQDYFQAYSQAMAETVAYTTKMTSIAMQIAQIAVAGGMKAGHAAAQGLPAAASARPEEMPHVPDIMTGAAQLQNMMMKNMTDWQQQVLRTLPAMNGIGPNGGGAGAPR